MPRKRRIHFNEALYHVMTQGNYRQQVFFDEDDYHYAYKLLERVVKNYACKIHLFCLMTNHIHIVMEVSHIPLSKIMQSFSSCYSKYLNKKMERNGHLFRGRFKDKLIQDEKYLLELCYYIHRNPLNAKIVDSLSDYPWSSHHCYTTHQELNWVSTELIQNLLSKYIMAQNPYIDFIMNRHEHLTQPIFCHVDAAGYLIITDSINAKISASKSLNIRHLSIDKIIEIICSRLDISLSLIQSKCKRMPVIQAKVLIAFFAHYHAQLTLIEIAYVLNTGPDSLSKIMQRQFASDEKYRAIKKKIEFLNREFMLVSLSSVKNNRIDNR